MTTTDDDRTRNGVRVAMQMLKDRQARFEDGGNADGENTHSGQYKLGLADAYGTAITLLEECTGIPSSGLRIQPPNAHMRPEGSRWLPQTDSHPFDLPVGDQR